jgi:hypothetical protein
MLRGSLIAICSAALVASSFGQTYNWTNVGTELVAVRNGFLQFGTSTTLTGAYLLWDGGSNSTTFRWRNTSLQPEYAPNVQRTAVFQMSGRAARSYTASAPDAGMPTTTFFWNGTNISFDSLATNSFSWTFGPEWAGTVLQVRATNGASLGTWGLPSVIGSNYVLSASIVTNQSLLTGAQVFLDGVPAAVLATAGTNSNLDAFADRPGYALSFGGDYQGGEWQIRRSDGSVAGTGSAATFGTVASGRVTLLPEGSTGSIWTRVPAGDGMGAVWVNSGISVSGNNVTTYNFATSPQPTPAPTPNLPTNAPAPSITNAPAPVPTPGTNTVAPSPVLTNDVTVDVETVPEIETDDGEQGVLNDVVAMHEKLRGILDDARGAFENVALTFNEFRKLTLGGVGTNCTFTMGTVTINLGGIVPPELRTGMKLIILLVGIFAAIRYVWESFT